MLAPRLRWPERGPDGRRALRQVRRASTPRARARRRALLKPSAPDGGERLSPPGVEDGRHRGVALALGRPGRCSAPAASRRPRAGSLPPRASAGRVATPIRRPVNVPGPRRPRSARPRPSRAARSITSATSASSRVACRGRSPGRRVVAASSSAAARRCARRGGGPRIAVSQARRSSGRRTSQRPRSAPPLVAARMLDHAPRGDRREAANVLAALGPLHEGDRVRAAGSRPAGRVLLTSSAIRNRST